MKTATKEDYQHLIDIGQSLLNHTQKQLPELPAERIPFVRFGQGLHALSTAVGHLMLGNQEESRHWFRTSAQYFVEARRQPDTVMADFRALECATFCGDREFRIEVARKIHPREGKRKPAEHPYAMFLKYTILYEQREALAWVNETVWHSRATLKKRGGYGTLQDVCTTFAHRQADGFAAALEGMLREHKMKASHGYTKVPEGMVCFPGATLTILAREAGMPVDVTSPFIPAALLND